MSLNAAETAYAELLERCKLPELTRQELLERFLEQSMAAEALALELVQLRQFKTDVHRAFTRAFTPAAPVAPRLQLVREET